MTESLKTPWTAKEKTALLLLILSALAGFGLTIFAPS